MPRTTQADLERIWRVVAGDRLDLIAARMLGDGEHFWQICDANNTMNPFDLTIEVGRTLRVPLPQFQEPT